MLCAYLPKRYFCTYLISPDRFKIRISNFDTIIIHMNVVHVQKMVKFGSAVFFRSEWVKTKTHTSFHIHGSSSQRHNAIHTEKGSEPERGGVHQKHIQVHRSPVIALKTHNASALTKMLITAHRTNTY